MRTLISLFIMALSFNVNAQTVDMPSMDGVNMQQMMQQMKKMQQCLLQVDETELRTYEAEILQLEPELRELCQANKRDLAQQKAIDFSQRISQSPSMKIIKSCTKNMQANGFMPTIPEFNDHDSRHVCDEIKR